MPYTDIEDRRKWDRENRKKEQYRAYRLKYYKENIEKIKAYNASRKEYFRSSRLNYLDKSMLYNAKHRAKVKGIPFNLDKEDTIIPERCPILNYSLVRAIGGRPLYNSPTLDKIIPALGYTKGNVQILSHRANIMKNDATPEELVLFAKWVQRTYPEMF